MHFRIPKMIATSGFLECTKFVFGRGSALDPVLGELIAFPQVP